MPAPPRLFINPHQPGLHLQVEFPEAAHAGPHRQSYWLSAGEDVVVEVQLAAGPVADPKPVDVRGVVMIDGSQTSCLVDQAPATRTVSRRLTAETVDRFVLRIPANRIARGAHSAALLFWRGEGGLFPSFSFDLFKEDERFRKRSENPLVAKTPSSGRGLNAVLVGTPPVMLRGQPIAVADGRAALRLVAERFPGDSALDALGVTFVALLDGRQIPLGTLGPHPSVSMTRQDRIEMSFEVAVDTRAETHLLTVFALPGDGVRREEEGVPSPVAGHPRMLGAALLR